MKKRTFQKTILLTVSLATIVCIATVTLAYLLDQDGDVKNTFEPSKVTCAVEESFTGDTKSNVSIQNTGDIEAYIRSAVVVTWKDADGNVYGKTPVQGQDYTIHFTDEKENSNWDFAKDGFYYYLKPVAPNEKTSVLIQECKPVEDRTPEGYGLSVEILGSAIQSVPVSVVTEQWSSGVSGIVEEDGVKKLTVRTMQ